MNSTKDDHLRRESGDEDLWFRENFRGVVSFGLRVKELIHREQSKYQDIAVYDTYQHGRMMALDGMVMLTELDEPAYHEMIVHVPMQTLQNPRRALVIGGGDGGTVRELVRYPGLEEIIMVEIDEAVVNVAREHLPSLAAGLEDPRVQIIFDDGARFIKGLTPHSMDLVIVDSTDPVGPAAVLVGEEFYHDAARALAEDGVLTAQTESPLYHGPMVKDIFRNVGQAFANNFMYWAVVPAYPGSIWSFCYASTSRHPVNDFSFTRTEGDSFKYYTPQLHKAAFAPPALALKCLPQGHPQREENIP